MLTTIPEEPTRQEKNPEPSIMRMTVPACKRTAGTSALKQLDIYLKSIVCGYAERAGRPGLQAPGLKPTVLDRRCYCCGQTPVNGTTLSTLKSWKYGALESAIASIVSESSGKRVPVTRTRRPSHEVMSLPTKR